jgi:anaerobic ribonucleoside-triphosphate reductase activating protein
MEQAAGLLDLLGAVRSETELSVVLFSGFTLDQIRLHRLGPEILSHIDVLIAGPYDASQPLKRSMLGSANQRVHLLSDRYTAADIERVPAAEALVAVDGTVTISGISPPRRP